MKCIMIDNRIQPYITLFSTLLIIFLLLTDIFGKTTNNSANSKMLEITYNDFNDISELQVNGDAAQADGINGNQCLRLTPSEFTQAGSFFSKNSIALRDSTGFNASFHTFFSFRMTESRTQAGIGDDSDGPGADGIVFVVQTIANNVGSSGGGIGYKGISRSVGIEFDTWHNGENDDKDGNHIGINTNGSSVSLQAVKIDERLNNGEIYYAWIDYNGITDILEVRFSDEPHYPLTPLMTYNIDLTSVLEEESAFVGFTSGTGASCNNHDILSFNFVNNSRISGLIEPQLFTIRESAVEKSTVGIVLIKESLKEHITLTQSGLSEEFSFNLATRAITIAENTRLNYENKKVYTFNVEALYVDTIAQSLINTTDDTALITIRVLKGNLIDPQSFSIKETEIEGFNVGTIMVNSPEPNTVKLDPLSIPEEFQCENSNNTIFIAPNAQFDYSRQEAYTFEMQAMFIDSIAEFLSDTLFDTALVTIRILQDITSVTEAVYSDKNGDGSIDCAIINLDRKPHALPQKIYFINPFDHNDTALIKKDDITSDDKTLTIKLPEPFAFSGSTNFQTEKFGSIEDPRYHESSFDIKDGVAPVIIEADYYPAKQGGTTNSSKVMDTLTVSFSETINEDIAYSKPFKFISKSNDTYTMTLRQIKKNETTHTFIVEEISNDTKPSTNSDDSVWIDTEAKISDELMNYQNTDNNRKVSLKVHKRTLQFVVKPLTPFTIGKTDITKIYNLMPQFLTGTVISVDFFDNIEDQISDYSIQIFDPVGNSILNSHQSDNNIDKILVTRKNQTKIFFFWNGYNTNKRPVAHGSYYGIVKAVVDDRILSKGFYLLVTSE